MLSVTQNAALWTAPELAVQAINATIAGSANAFAQRHHFAFLQPGQTPDGHTWLLQLGGELPVLRRPDGVTWSIDFRSGDARRRANERNAMQQPLARALGLSKLTQAQREQWHIVDGTAGAGADAWQLASVGARVTLVEQHAVLHTMLAAALTAAGNNDHSAVTAQRCEAICENMHTLLSGSDEQNRLISKPSPNAIYLDPMYPSRRSTAAVKKPMQFIQALVGKGPDPEQLLATCLHRLMSSDMNRVVVKRPAEAVGLTTPDFWQGQQVSVSAGAARFDVYLTP